MAPAASPTTPLFALSEHHLRQLLFASQAFNSTLELEVLIPRILDLFAKEVRSAGAATLLVTHSDVAASVADRALTLTRQGLVNGRGR